MKLLKIVFVLFIMSSCASEEIAPDLSNQKEVDITNAPSETEGEDNPTNPPPPTVN